MIRLLKFWAAVTLGLILASCATVTTDGREGFVPLDAGRSGAVATIDVHVSWMSRSYPRSIVLAVGLPESKWLDENSHLKTDLKNKFDELISSLSGKKIFDYYDGQMKPHKGVRFFVTWKEKRSGRVLQQGEVIADYAMSRVCTGSGTCLSIDSIPLDAGNYLVTVRVLDDDPRFDGTFETGLFAGYTWK